MKERALIVLGGGLTKDDQLTEHARLRYEKALEIHDKYDYIICSSRWTYRKEGKNHAISEAEAGKRYLMGRDVSAHKILLEDKSRDTLSNAFYCRKLWIDPLQIREFTVVTSKFHLPKSKFVFRVVFPSPRYTIKFVGSENGVRDRVALKNRVQHEKEVLTFYKKHLLTTYKVKRGDMKSIEGFMKYHNPAMGAKIDIYFRKLSDNIENSKKLLY